MQEIEAGGVGERLATSVARRASSRSMLSSGADSAFVAMAQIASFHLAQLEPIEDRPANPLGDMLIALKRGQFGAARFSLISHCRGIADRSTSPEEPQSTPHWRVA